MSMPAASGVYVDITNWTYSDGSAGEAAGPDSRDNSDAIEKALARLYELVADGDAEASGGCLVFPPGAYRTTRTLVIDRHGIQLVGCRSRICLKTGNMTAVRFEPPEDEATNVGSGIEGLTIENFDDTPPPLLWGFRGVDADWDIDRVGLELVNCVDFRGIDIEVWKFAVGIRITAAPVLVREDGRWVSTAPTCGFGVYELGHVANCKTGIALAASGGATLVSNTFYGGYFGGPVGAKFLEPTDFRSGIPHSRNLYLRGRCHNTQLYNTIMEGVLRYHIELANGAPEGQEPQVPSGLLLSACHLEADQDEPTQTLIKGDGRNITILGGSLQGPAALGTSLVLGEEAGPTLLLNVQTVQRWFPVEGVAYNDEIADLTLLDPADIEDGARVFGMYSTTGYIEDGVAFWFPDLAVVEFGP